MEEKPELYFPPAYKKAGFRVAAMARANNKKPFSVIRELLQNSYDAAIEANCDLAEVKFSFDDVKLRDIPGVKEYTEAVNCIAEEQLAEPEKDIVSTIQCELNKERLRVLFVTDNGIGFNNERMVAVVADGVSHKESPDSSSGSYGNGHFSAFSISNLRYILYGGCLKTKEKAEKIASGVALLKTHKDSSGDLRSNDGTYVTNFDKPIIAENKNFPSGTEIPEMIENRLNEIQEKRGGGGSGSVVVIPGFNNFGDDNFNEKEVSDLILGTAARNFFVAVSEGQLRVKVEAGNYTDCLEQESLGRILKETSEEKAISPRYQTVEKFYNTLKEGRSEKIKTSEGGVEIRYLKDRDGKTQFAFFRNGMWITNKITFGLKKDAFTDHQPHNILVLPEKESKLSSLIKDAESSSHDSIELGIMNNPDKKRRLRQSFKEIKERLQEILPRDDNEEINIPILGLEIEMAGDVVDAPGKSVRKSTKTRDIKTPQPGNLWNKDDEILHPPGPGPGPHPKHRKPRRGKVFKPKKFSCLHNNSRGKATMKFILDKKVSSLELMPQIDGGVDPSCDSLSQASDSIDIKIISAQARVEVNNRTEEKDFLEVSNGSITVGEVQPDQTWTIELHYNVPKLSHDYSILCNFKDMGAKVKQEEGANGSG